jgi:transporter family protein
LVIWFSLEGVTFHFRRGAWYGWKGRESINFTKLRDEMNARKSAMKSLLLVWPMWAALSAIFAALTAIFGKIGVEDVNSDFATLIRTIVILAVLAPIVMAGGAWQPLESVSRRTWLFLVLSGLATGASWLCYYRALKLGPASGVAPVDKLSVLLVALFAVAFLGERLEFRNWIGIGMVAMGTALVALRG